jgi:hypothetical protein
MGPGMNQVLGREDMERQRTDREEETYKEKGR